MLANPKLDKTPSKRESSLRLQTMDGPTFVSTDTEDAVESVVRELNAICKTATFEFSVAVGALIIDRFYGGRLDSWRGRGPKEQSLRKLAAHPQLPMSPAALYRSLAIYELCERLGIRKWKHLSTTHIRAVLPLPPHEQEHLLRSAEMCRMTVRQLEREVACLRARDQIQGGRPRLNGSKTIVKRLEKCLESLDELMGTNSEADMSPEAAGAMHRLIGRIRDTCAKLEPRTIDASLE